MKERNKKDDFMVLYPDTKTKEQSLKDPQKRVLSRLTHPQEFLKFAEWISLPTPFREPKTQGELSKVLGVGQDTLSVWKKIPAFWDFVHDKTIEWGREKTPNVIAALYRKAVKDGNAAEAKMWLQYIEEWSEKIETENKNLHFIITRGDGRSTTNTNRPVPGAVSAVAQENSGGVV